MLEQLRAQALQVAHLEGDQFLIAVELLGDAAFSDADALGAERSMDLRHTAVLGKAQVADAGDDIQAKLAMRQGVMPLACGAYGLMIERTGRIGAAAHGQDQAH